MGERSSDEFPIPGNLLIEILKVKCLFHWMVGTSWLTVFMIRFISCVFSSSLNVPHWVFYQALTPASGTPNVPKSWSQINLFIIHPLSIKDNIQLLCTVELFEWYNVIIGIWIKSGKKTGKNGTSLREVVWERIHFITSSIENQFEWTCLRHLNHSGLHTGSPCDQFCAINRHYITTVDHTSLLAAKSLCFGACSIYFLMLIKI